MTEISEKLLEHCNEYATDLLKETGDCYPFGAYIDTIDNVHPLEMEIDPKKMPNIGQVMQALEIYCKEEMTGDRMKAYAICYEADVTISETETLTCITIDITNPTDEAPLFYLPFTQSDLGTGVQEIFAVKR